MTQLDLLAKIERLSAIGIDLSAEKDHDQLLESILMGAKEIAGSDGGTLYLLQDDNSLHFEIIISDSLNILMGGKSGNPVTLSPVPLYDLNGNPNKRNVVSCAALENCIINIEDAYISSDYDFSGTRKFDAKSGYRSKSFLSVPMKNHEDKLIGVLQLINAIDPATSGVTTFTKEDEKLVSSLASQAAVALTRKDLIDGLENLLQALVKLVATAIDEKSPYTGGHCKRVPELTMLMAEAVNAENTGSYGDILLSDADLHELEMAAWLHDCGKITTPEYVVDKSTKLETIFDRIALVDARINLLEHEAEIDYLSSHAESNTNLDSKEAALHKKQEKLNELAEIRSYLHRVNTGGEFLSPEESEQIKKLANLSTKYSKTGQASPLLTSEETENLCISKGTLNDKERASIQNHIVATINMLNSLPFPEHLKRVPSIAGAHHERLDGKGYPNGLTAEQLPLQARILALADIFEALTASDRPYRARMPLSKALSILGYMTKEGHLDPDMFRLFVDRKLYLNYAEKYLVPEQIDPVDHESLPGYRCNAGSGVK